MTLTDRLVDFVATAQPDDEVTEVLRQSLFDWVACGVAGVAEPVAGIVRAQALDDGGAAQSVVFGGGRVPARAAAFTNGTISHALDYDDTHFGHIGHTSAAIYAAVMAAGPATLDAAIDAACIGSEVAVRVGQWLGRDHYQIGFHQTATAGAFGATAAVARLRALTQAHTGHALGLAATQAAGLKSQFGTMGKPMNAGLAAQCGVVSADLAARGMISNPDALDGPQGFTRTHHAQRDVTALNGLGDQWRMIGVSHKLHACCHGLHAMIEALRQIHVPVKRLKEVEIRTHPRWLTVCNLPAPATGLEAKFSYPHVAAMVMSDRDTAAISSFSDACAQDDDLIALRQRVTVVADESVPETAAKVIAGLDDHSTREAAFDLMDETDPDEKWRALQHKAATLIGSQAAAALMPAVYAGELSQVHAIMTT